MTEQHHTPGPWYFGLIGNYDNNGDTRRQEKPFDYDSQAFSDNPYILSQDGEIVVGCGEYNVFNSPADARLLTAAPELLEALEELVFQYVALQKLDGHKKAAIDASTKSARAAIAKAKP